MYRVTAKDRKYNQVSFLLRDHLAATCFAGDLLDHMENGDEVVISRVEENEENPEDDESPAAPGQ